MKRPSVFLGRRSELEVAMTPMIDVVFLLLVFFVWTASFQVVEYALPANVAQTAGGDPMEPTAPPPPEMDFDQIVVRVMPGPRFELNGQTLSSNAQLRERLAAVAAIRREAPAIIHPDPDTPLGPAVDAFDIARAVGLSQVAFAAPQS